MQQATTLTSSQPFTPTEAMAGTDKSSDSSKSSMSPKQKGKLPPQMILALIGLVLLLVGAVAAFFLTQINQDIRQQAAGETYGVCTNSSDSICVDGFRYVCTAPGSPYVKKDPPEACPTTPPSSGNELETRYIIVPK